MKKQIERAALPEARLQQHTFTRASRSWQHVAVLASTGFSPLRRVRSSRASGAPTWSDDSSWILRQRLN